MRGVTGFVRVGAVLLVLVGCCTTYRVGDIPVTSCLDHSATSAFGWSTRNLTKPIILHSSNWEGSVVVNYVMGVLIRDVYGFSNVTVRVRKDRYNNSLHEDNPYFNIAEEKAYIAGDVWEGGKEWYTKFHFQRGLYNGLRTRPGVFVDTKLTTDLPTKDFGLWTALLDQTVLDKLPAHNFRASGKGSDGQYYCRSDMFEWWCDSEGMYTPPQCAERSACRQLWHRYPEDNEGEVESLIKKLEFETGGSVSGG